MPPRLAYLLTLVMRSAASFASRTMPGGGGSSVRLTRVNDPHAAACPSITVMNRPCVTTVRTHGVRAYLAALPAAANATSSSRLAPKPAAWSTPHFSRLKRSFFGWNGYSEEKKSSQLHQPPPPADVRTPDAGAPTGAPGGGAVGANAAVAASAASRAWRSAR